MRRIRTALAAIGLAAVGVTVPLGVPSAQADTRCNQEWDAFGRDGKVRIYKDPYCTNQLDWAVGDDWDWGDGTGEITNATNTVSSVMNNGTLGGVDVVAFYDYTGYDWRYGYTCLKPGEYYADYLADNRFSARTAGEHAGKKFLVNDAISSHKWVTEGDCNTFVE
ncbi:hypothetical protein ACIBQX_33840 [Nonomuraea sp. NPDC049714]|uniref:hypothetical protein n=1 Tax=Nonomuraea sp. NPDC049714 TaxID=3364357 RepID=UPI003794841D